MDAVVSSIVRMRPRDPSLTLRTVRRWEDEIAAPPPDRSVEPSATSSPVFSAEAAAVQAQPVGSDAAHDDETLPEGWEEVYDPATGRNYFYQAETGVSLWERPNVA